MRSRIAGALVVAVSLIVPSLAFAQVTSTSTTPQAAASTIGQREHRQAQRIRQGVKSGQLTKGELGVLKGERSAFRAQLRAYRQSGSGIDRAEHRQLEKSLNRTGRQIRRLKHNHRVRHHKG